MRAAPLVVGLVVGLALAGLGCGKDRGSAEDRGAGPSAGDRLEGTIVVDGQARTLVACRPRAGIHIGIEVVTDRGTLRFEDQRLSWNDDVDSILVGAPLTCTRLDRSWGGGRRIAGDAYWRGTLAFECTGGARTFVGDLRLDCGKITPTERAQLDRNRNELLDEQRSGPDSAGSGSGSGSATGAD